MDNNPNPVPHDVEKLKEIPKWSQRYAANRSLTLLALMLMTILCSISIAVPVSGLFAAVLKKNILLGLVSVIALAALSILFIIFILKFGGKNRGLLDRLIDNKIYRQEGIISTPSRSMTGVRKFIEVLLGIVFGVGLLGIMNLGMRGYIPCKYIQPSLALITVPCTVISWYFYRQPKMGPIYLLFPILYTIHAILILIGVPIFFTGKFGVLFNMSVPYFIYGLLPFILGHFYSRFALKKLRNLAQIQEDSSNGV